MRIALFGGSFDPPHLGHVLCACYAYAIGGVDRVWVLPVHEHPYGKAMRDWENRWALCEAAFRGYGFVDLRDDERRNPGGRTVTLVERLRRERPDDEWFLVGGSDTERDLGNWYRGEELRTMVRVIAVPRRGYDEHPAALPAISSTEVRRRLAAGDDARDLLPSAVAELIRRHGWYR